MYTYSLTQRTDGGYDLIVEIPWREAEFGFDLWGGNSAPKPEKQLAAYLAKDGRQKKIKTIRFVVAGLLVAVIPFSAATVALAESPHFTSIADGVLAAVEQAVRAGDKFHMTYLYGGSVSQQIAQVQAVANFDTVSPSYFDISAQGELSLNGVSATLVDAMHQMGIKVVPMLSNHWDRTAGERALQDPEKLAGQIIDAINTHGLDGVNVDIENVTAAHRDAYTQLVRILRQRLPAGKEVSVAVAANPNGWTTGWHGSYDYAGLAQYADYLMIMAYDESWEGSAPGPVASAPFVEKSIRYALQHAPAEKIVLGVPLYGRIWSADGRLQGNGISIKTLERMLADYRATITYSDTMQSPKAEFTVREGDKAYTVAGKPLTPGNYTVWFENGQSLQAKAQLMHQYDLKGLGSWALSQASDEVLGQLPGWVEGESEEEVSLSGKVTASSLRIRRRPTTASDTIGFLAQGQQVTIVARLDGWYRIRLADNGYGYVSADYIQVEEPEVPPVITRTGYSTGDRVRVRAQPSTGGDILRHLSRGDAFTVVGETQNSWYQVQLADGTAGYVHSDYVSFTRPEVDRSAYSTGDRVRVRARPSTVADILGLLNRGDAFTAVGEVQNGWYRVRLADGTEGYVHSDYVALGRGAHITGNSVRLRSQSSTASAVLGLLNRGDMLTVIGEKQNGWYWVRLPSGVLGYVHGDYVALDS